MEIKNALIERTNLGINDHGCMSVDLTLSYGSTGQVFGGYAIDGKPAERNYACERRPSILCGAFIKAILRVVGVDTWEQVKGKHVRARIGRGGLVVAIGNLLDDRWFDPQLVYGMLKDELDHERESKVDKLWVYESAIDTTA